MTRNKQINERISLNVTEVFGDTTVKVYVDSVPVHVCKVNKTGAHFGVGYAFNGFYLVIFSRDASKEQNQLKIEAVFDLKKQSVVQITEKNEEVFKYMCIEKKKIAVAVVLQFLNASKLQVTENGEIDEFIRYVTAENDDITKEEIKEYILKVYPDFANYMNLTSALSVIEYRKILSELNVEFCEFHIMPHLLK